MIMFIFTAREMGVKNYHNTVVIFYTSELFLQHPFIESASGPSVLSDLMKQSMAVRVARLAQEKKQ